MKVRSSEVLDAEQYDGESCFMDVNGSYASHHVETGDWLIRDEEGLLMDVRSPERFLEDYVPVEDEQ